MKAALLPGIYESLLTEKLDDEIIGLEEGLTANIESVDSSIRVDLLTHHFSTVLRSVLEQISDQDKQTRTTKQIALINNLLELLESKELHLPKGSQVNDRARILKEVLRQTGVGETAFARPTQSLRHTGLLVNGKRDVQIASEIAKEIPSSDRIDLLCAFIRHSGLRLFERELAGRINSGAKVRVIASVYTGSTERRALDKLVDLGADVKISYDVARTRLHAKAWLFHRNSGFHTAYIGSSNLTHMAQVDGLEWNVRISAVENPAVIERFATTFDQYWEEPEFEDYKSTKEDVGRLDAALAQQNNQNVSELSFIQIDVSPKPHQEVALEALESERKRNHFRNLVVSATGTGKTWIAAFDYKRIREQKLGNSLLFVAHRKEILEQSKQVFSQVLHDHKFGELLVEGRRPKAGHYVFASIQSLAKYVETIDPNDFDVVIVDEFHHAAATSYDKLLQRLKPKVLLGLTATPERPDGKSILNWFDGRVAYESRLWDALDLGLLCPFHYFGIHDPTDLSSVRFERGRYVLGELDNVLTGNDVRANAVRQAMEEIVTFPHQMRALGFCAGVGHAHFMARKFNDFGYQSVALDGTTNKEERSRAVQKLRKGDLRVIFTVDLFNEGVDLPEVDTIFLLRPTESATVFLQQLGRGLRWSDGKSVLTVMDFVGQVRKEYRYEVRYRALLGGTHHQVQTAVEQDFPLLPPGCAVKMDRVAKEIVLRNLKQAIRSQRRLMVNDLLSLGGETRLSEFIKETNYDLMEIYSKPTQRHSFTELRQSAGFVEERSILDGHAKLLRSIGRVIHVDDLERLDLWKRILDAESSMKIPNEDCRERRLYMMFVAIFGGRGYSIDDAAELLSSIHQFTELHDELSELVEILADRFRSVPEPIDPNGVIPLSSHASYSLGEIMAAYGVTDRNNAIHFPQTGVYWYQAAKTDLLFITLEKSEKDYSPKTRYADYPISPTLFHWESQHTTAKDSPTGKRYINQPNAGTNVVLFVRERKSDIRGETAPYHCLGKAHYQRHESERPMKIIWKLERPMPGWLYQDSK